MAAHLTLQDPRLRILIVDDEPIIAQLLSCLLRDEHDVSTTFSGKEALARLVGGERFDIIFCDMIMPIVTGMKIYEWLQTHDPRQAKRMVFMTGGAFTSRARDFLECLETPLLEKPFDIYDIQALITDLAEEFR